MKSLRTKITVTMVILLLVALTVITVTSVISIRRTEHNKNDQLLLLLCETGERNLDYYFNSVQKSVTKVASFVEADLDGLTDEQLARHMERVLTYFEVMAAKTNGVLTYYYRIDPEVSTKVKGFWYTNTTGDDFVEHEVTDITLYDTSDTSSLVWFTVPKYKGEAVWLPPYITDNLDMRVISYNVPIFWRGRFVGVVGIEIDYSTMAEQVDSIRLFSNGYAFLSDAKGNLFYHPRIDVTQLNETTMPAVPDGLVGASTFIRYRFEGVDKEAAWLSLSNGMRLNVTAPASETYGQWQSMIWNVMVIAVGTLAAASLFLMLYTRRITRPLEQLTEAAEQADRGNYEHLLDYDKDDELGRLTNTFKRLSGHMKDNISDLNRQVYVDALTHVKNKGAFSSAVEEMQVQLEDNRGRSAFGIAMFDCDELKMVNDKYGHGKGDEYLKTASRVICRVFQHSPVFRIGGDEFCVILRNEDYQNRDALVRQFEQTKAELTAAAENRWEQVHVSIGVAVFDPEKDRTVNDVVRRADEIMYENKRRRKSAR